jgi:hypothetical protein
MESLQSLRRTDRFGGARTNAEVGGRVIELAQHEYALRGRGYIKDKADIEQAVLATNQQGTPSGSETWPRSRLAETSGAAWST